MYFFEDNKAQSAQDGVCNTHGFLSTTFPKIFTNCLVLLGCRGHDSRCIIVREVQEVHHMDDDDDEWRRGLDRNEGAGLMRSVNCWCGGGG